MHQLILRFQTIPGCLTTYCTTSVHQACTVYNYLFKFLFVLFKAIFLLHADRIGHGYHVLEDSELYKHVIEKQIHLEVSMTQ